MARKTARTTESHTAAYRGYLVTHNTILGRFLISKDGHHVGSANTAEEARSIIDTLIPPFVDVCQEDGIRYSITVRVF